MHNRMYGIGLVARAIAGCVCGSTCMRQVGRDHAPGEVGALDFVASGGERRLRKQRVLSSES